MMKSKQDLEKTLKSIDHKSYGMYKSLAGEYQFGNFIFYIDKVQGDPFAAPSRVRVRVPKTTHGFPASLYEKHETKIALEDMILRQWNKVVQGYKGRGAGSGNSGKIAVCPCGQEILERMAVVVGKEEIEGRFLIGLPAKGRSIYADALTEILFGFLPKMVDEVFTYGSYAMAKLEENKRLAEDQTYIRNKLEELGLVAFIADGSILPRESGISERPLKGAVPFSSPESQRIHLKLPHYGEISGMGIKKGITVIVGGGYHGKSTLLRAIELGVYNHKKGDGREYVITNTEAVKIRAEDGRNICKTDIRMFINHLPNKTDTRLFTTENASGSTSQSANMIEAMEAGATAFLVDEDTSATNFMVRDSIMEKIVSKEKEPITPFIARTRALYQKKGISTIIVVGSSSAYFEVADTILQLDNYEVKDIKEMVEQVLAQQKREEIMQIEDLPEVNYNRVVGKIDMSYKGRDMKVKTTGRDTISLNKENIDVRYLEQLMDNGQTVAIGYFLKYMMETMVDNKKTMQEIVEALYAQIEKRGFSHIIPKGYSAGFCVLPRKQEVYAAWNRFRGLRLEEGK